MFRALAVFFLFVTPALAQHQAHRGISSTTGSLSENLGNLHHKVSTKSPEAQKYFDQGLTYVYAFNHDEAVRSFEQALKFDPNLAMAHWGIALALGPNINLDVDPAREKAAYEAVRKATRLSKKAPKRERDYISALATRYSIDPKADLKKLAADYSAAMRRLMKKYPDDLDAATLFAESAMTLRPWKLWTLEGKPEEGTEEIVAVLESVLRRDPVHVGANHYYIHAVEASTRPERAMSSAERLETLVPAAGHLVHMPAHIYMRTGDFEAAAVANERGAEADRAYIAKSGAQGIYPLMYYNHNLHFLAIARSMQGKSTEAMQAADELYRNLLPHVEGMAMLEPFMATPLLILARFHMFDLIHKYPVPPRSRPTEKMFYHYALGIALAADGKPGNAGVQRQKMTGAIKDLPPDLMIGLNPAKDVAAIALLVLDGKIAMAMRDPDRAIPLFWKAVAAQDKLAYDEPPDFYYPVRETLGAALLRADKHAEAEKVFREDLKRNPGNARSLHGLLIALSLLGRDSEMAAVEEQIERAWKGADVAVNVDGM